MVAERNGRRRATQGAPRAVAERTPQTRPRAPRQPGLARRCRSSTNFASRCARGSGAFAGRGAAELVLQDFTGYFLDRAAGEKAELEGAVGEPDQAGDGVAEMLEDAPHLAVLAFVQRQRDPGVGALLAVERGADRAVGEAVDRDAAGQRREPRRVDVAMHPHTVPAHPAGRRQFETAG